MSEATHTLGPWTTFNETDIYPDDGDNTARRHIADCDVSNAPITTQDGSSTDLTYGECRANARLIAAAPDMLEALEHNIANCPVCDGEGVRYAVLLSVAVYECGRCAPSRAVVAKATGNKHLIFKDSSEDITFPKAKAEATS